MTIPYKLTAKEMVITDKLTVSSLDNNLKGVDIIKLIKTHDDEISDVKSILNQTKTSVNITDR